MTTKLVQSVKEKLLSFQRKNQPRAFSARIGPIHSQWTRALLSTWLHHSDAAFRPSRIRMSVRGLVHHVVGRDEDPSASQPFITRSTTRAVRGIGGVRHGHPARGVYEEPLQSLGVP